MVELLSVVEVRVAFFPGSSVARRSLPGHRFAGVENPPKLYHSGTIQSMGKRLVFATSDGIIDTVSIVPAFYLYWRMICLS